MSIHKSLRIKSQLLRARNVWSRLERIQKLEEQGKFAADGSIFGLPKVRTRFKVKGVKAPKPAAAEAAPAEGAAPAAATAAAAAPAKPAAASRAATPAPKAAARPEKKR